MDIVIREETPLRVALALDSHWLPFTVVPLLPIGAEYTAVDGSVLRADDRVPIPDQIGRGGAKVSLRTLFKKYPNAGVGVRLGQLGPRKSWLVEIVVKDYKQSKAVMKRL